MDRSFHYYGTYCAAYLAGYSHEESLEICYAATLVDHCSKTFLKRIGGPSSAATTQLPGEMGQARSDPIGIADTTRIWSAFHFLPYDLHARVHKGNRRYRDKYRLICGPNGDLLVDTVNLAQGKGTQAIGLALHVLADTWAHRNFAGTPSLVINNTNQFFVELVPADLVKGAPSPNEANLANGAGQANGSSSAGGTCQADVSISGYEAGAFIERPVKFRHNPAVQDDLDAGVYTNTVYMADENAVMNLGHGRAGHLPDFSFARYRYAPAWANYEMVLKDNPAEFYQAFCQMVYAMGCLRGTHGSFEKDVYDTATVAPYEQAIRGILEKRQLKDAACEEWRAFGQELTGCEIPDFDIGAYEQEYLDASEGVKDDTFLGKFILAALAQKGMFVNRVWSSGNPIAGRSIDYGENGFVGIRDFLPLIGYLRGGDDRE